MVVCWVVMRCHDSRDGVVMIVLRNRVGMIRMMLRHCLQRTLFVMRQRLAGGHRGRSDPLDGEHDQQ